jgi:hypothetical protein
MAKFPYTPNPKNVTEFFSKMQSVGVPSKVDIGYLKSIGFTSSNDRYLVGVVKSLGFATGNGSPTDRWQTYRIKATAGSTMASAIKDTYKKLFEIHHDANAKDDQTLQDYFKANTTSAESVVQLMLQTFKNLCALADFEAVPAEASVSEPTVHLPTKEEAARIPTSTPGLTVNINIQLTLPATDDETVYDRLFASLKRNFPRLS